MTATPAGAATGGRPAGTVARVSVGRRPWRRAGLVAMAAALVSLAATGGIVAADRVGARSAVAAVTAVEAAGLLVLVVLAVRHAPASQAAGAVAAAAVAVGLSVARFEPPPAAATVAAGAVTWGGAVIGAGGAGLYLRSLDRRRRLAVVAAQDAQRLQLARDLHDYVAHDVSEMLALAQAGQVVATGDPPVARILRSIEDAGQRALASMDRAVHALQGAVDREGSPAAGPPTLADLPVLTRRFAAASGVAVDLVVDDRTWDAVRAAPTESSAALYRVAVEALTNVRRHAASARAVRVALRAMDATGGRRAALELSVTDDGRAGAAPAAAGRQGGLGLAGLAEQLRDLGGTLEAGPRAPAGWAVTATVTLTGAPAVDGGGS
ncbi:MAG TPA: histidine kinase [Acidimicrobiales bacterium]